MKISISLNTNEYYICEPDPDSKWDHGKQGLELIYVCVNETDKDYEYEIQAEIGDSVVVLIEHYRDGDTFGSSEYMEVKGVYKTQNEAEEASLKINTGHGYFGCHIDFIFQEEAIGKKQF